MQAIIDACKERRLNAEAAVVISNNSRSMALKRAEDEGIPFYHLSTKIHPDPCSLDHAILNILMNHRVNLVVLAGYMKRLGPEVVKEYRGRILNIHPALLPKYGGKGMYGRLVHEAVLSAGEKVTGVTVHIVDDEYDHGPIVAQITVPVREEDTVDTLSERVLEYEHSFYVETLEKISRGEIQI